MYRTRNTKNRHNCNVLFEGRDGIEFFVFDTETTGLDPKNDHIVQFSSIKYKIENHSMKKVEEFDLFIKPPFPMPQKAEAVHHISDEMLKDSPMEHEAIKTILGFWGERPIVVGYNVNFDIGMIKAMYERCNQSFTPYFCLDVLEMIRDVSPDSAGYKLEQITKEFGLDAGISFHSAIDDVRATGMLLELSYRLYKDSPLPEDLEKPYVNRFWYWKGYNKSQSGIWVSTNLGKMYYSTFHKAWMSSGVDMNHVNVDDMENYIMDYLGITYAEFSKITERKYEQLISVRKLQEVACVS